MQTYHSIKEECEQNNAQLVAVSKTKPASQIQEMYDLGQRIFGENKVQELCEKADILPKDIEWHLIGHLQSNKVKYIAPFVSLIHAVDSIKLLKEINKQALKNDRVIDCLLQIKIAEEDSKFGIDPASIEAFLAEAAALELNNVRIRGLMGMATFTSDENQIKEEFHKLSRLKKNLSEHEVLNVNYFDQLSMGMSGDYKIALKEGSNLVRIGSLLFGARNYG